MGALHSRATGARHSFSPSKESHLDQLQRVVYRPGDCANVNFEAIISRRLRFSNSMGTIPACTTQSSTRSEKYKLKKRMEDRGDPRHYDISCRSGGRSSYKKKMCHPRDRICQRSNDVCTRLRESATVLGTRESPCAPERERANSMRTIGLLFSTPAPAPAAAKKRHKLRCFPPAACHAQSAP